MDLIKIPDECIFLPVLIINARFFHTIVTSGTIFAPVNNAEFTYTGKSWLDMRGFNMIFLGHNYYIYKPASEIISLIIFSFPPEIICIPLKPFISLILPIVSTQMAIPIFDCASRLPESFILLICDSGI